MVIKCLYTILFYCPIPKHYVHITERHSKRYNESIMFNPPPENLKRRIFLCLILSQPMSGWRKYQGRE